MTNYRPWWCRQVPIVICHVCGAEDDSLCLDGDDEPNGYVCVDCMDNRHNNDYDPDA